jgi:hypothetical protein
MYLLSRMMTVTENGNEVGRGRKRGKMMRSEERTRKKNNRSAVVFGGERGWRRIYECQGREKRREKLKASDPGSSRRSFRSHQNRLRRQKLALTLGG